MVVTVILGGQFGDEGKGRIVDYLAKSHHIIVRFQGGANAGHTVVVGNKRYVFHLLPSGILWKDKVNVIASGVAVDPEILYEEIISLGGLENLLISKRATVVLRTHKFLDEAQEKYRKGKKVGTTKRGIGPAYSDTTARINLTMEEFIRNEEKIIDLLKFHLVLLENVYNYKTDFNVQKYLEKLRPIRGFLARYLENTEYYLNEELEKGKKILLEGAQGTMLDIRFGTYPFVTSSNTTIGGAIIGTGIPPKQINRVIGVFKAYLTRVGSGPMPSEINGKIAEYIRKVGKEYGATTGRPRRIGWFDLVMAKYSCMVNGFDEIALTKVDVLSGIKKIKIATAYEINSEETKRFPSSIEELRETKPIYEELEGWEKFDRRLIKRFEDLPTNLKRFVEYLEEKLNTRISMVSYGPRREDIVFRE